MSSATKDLLKFPQWVQALHIRQIIIHTEKMGKKKRQRREKKKKKKKKKRGLYFKDHYRPNILRHPGFYREILNSVKMEALQR